MEREKLWDKSCWLNLTILWGFKSLETISLLIRETLEKLNLEKPGISGFGATKSGSLEMSNVDFSMEFTEMITTQRGFQANSRIITASDEMLQELVNMKR